MCLDYNRKHSLTGSPYMKDVENKNAREFTVKITEISEYWSRALMCFVSNRTGHSEEKHTNTKKTKGTFYMSERSSNRSLDNTTRNV